MLLGGNTSYLGHDISFSIQSGVIVHSIIQRVVCKMWQSYFAGSGYGSGIYSRLLHERGMLGRDFSIWGMESLLI